MTDNENTDNTVVTHILTLKDQVLKWAAPKKHLSNNPEDYGKATTKQYGHVIVSDQLDAYSDNPVKSSVIRTYIDEKISTVTSKIPKIIFNTTVTDISHQTDNDEYNIPTTKAVFEKLKSFQPKFNVVTTVTKDSTNTTSGLNNIPTAKAVWDALSSYKDLLVGVSYKTPQSYKSGINSLTTAGYYIMNHDKTKPKSFSYGGETIHYTNALVTVKKQSNRIIQHVCATTKVTSSSNANNYTYKINGSEYTRYGSYNSNGETTWKPWHLAHKPYSKTSRAKIADTKNVDANSVVVYENTAGFIIQWKQTRANKTYPVTAPLYEYKDVCTFDPPLPITGPYVFGNLIGRLDIRITSNKMQIRSNVAPGGRIIGVEETYFVPRNQ